MSFLGKVHERILRKFLYHGVQFVLVGGHAAVFYGVRRTTSDIDILVWPSKENGTKILNAFKDLRNRNGEKKLVDQQDILALRKILKSR